MDLHVNMFLKEILMKVLLIIFASVSRKTWSMTADVAIVMCTYLPTCMYTDEMGKLKLCKCLP